MAAAIAERDEALENAAENEELIAQLEQEVINANNAKDEADKNLQDAEQKNTNLENQLKEAQKRAEDAEKIIENMQYCVSISTAEIEGIEDKNYTGSRQNQNLIVKLGEKTLVEGSDYKLIYSDNKNVGNASVTVVGEGKYNGSVSRTFKINPKGTSLSKVTKGKKSMTVKWKKQATQVTGYKIRYSLKKDFSANTKTVTVKKASTTKTTIKKLKAKKVYYVQIRTFKTVDNETFYSDWSAVKSVKVK